MARQIINTGAAANDGTGDALRFAFTKSNDNFAELYNKSGDLEASITSLESDINSSLATLESSIPTDVSQLTDTTERIPDRDYNRLFNKPFIPSDISELTDDENLLSSISLGNIDQDLIPNEDSTYDIGSLTNQWRSLYVSSNTIFIGGTPISVDSEGNLTVSGSPVVGAETTTLPFLELTNTAIKTTNVLLDDAVFFEKADYDTGNTAIDFIDEGVAITRNNRGWLYNPFLDLTGFAVDSPNGTLWNGDDTNNLNDYKERDYLTLFELYSGEFANLPGKTAIMKDTINNKYYLFEWLGWTQGQNGGGFSYNRSLILGDPSFFEKTNNGSEIDVIIPDDGEGSGVGITRGNNQGIFNPYREEGWDSDVSPVGTLWNIDGWEDLLNVETRTYTNFYAAYGNGGLGNKVPGSKAIMYVPDNGKYYAIRWLSWTQGGNGGGFSYTRREIDLTQLNEGVKFSDGSVLKTSKGIGQIKSTASRGRRIEEAVGSKTVSVTEVTTQDPVEGTIYSTTTNDYYIYINWDVNLYALYDGDTNFGFEISFDNSTWYNAEVVGSSTNNFLQIYLVGDRLVSVEMGDPVYYRISTGGDPVVWWNKANLPGGSANFRGAVIDYHAYSGQATWIGTIHIVDDSGEEHITHTEVMSGSTDGENDDLWFVENEGTISYRRIDGEAKTLKIHWSAKVFYGEEYWD
jgi:hypothetical protein